MRKNWVSILLVIFSLLIVILADSGNLPRAIKNLYNFPNGDKIGHFLLMGLLSFVLNWTALVSSTPAPEAERSGVDKKPATVIWAVSLTLSFFVTLEEFSQIFFRRRTFSLLDLLFSLAGIVLFAWLASFFHARS
jgi:polysaccharide biosynthesis protein VpsQ